MEEEQKVSRATLLRLPSYLRLLQQLRQEGIEAVTSTVIADQLHLNAIQVRKDLAIVSSVSGKPKRGFETAGLIRDLQSFLGYDSTSNAIIVGVGGLGKALMAYTGFQDYGLEIVAAFDSDVRIVGVKLGGTMVYHTDSLESYVQKNGILIGIITVPKTAAQSVCDQMVASGIRAIWNFAPAHLATPEGIAVRNEDMAASLAVLSKDLARITRDKN